MDMLRLLMPLLLLLCAHVAYSTVLVGVGSNLPAQVIADAQFAYRFTEPKAELQYYPSESQAGICRLESFADKCDPADARGPKDIDFATSVATLNQTDYDNYTDVQMYPVLATAIVPVYNLRGVRNLVLTRTALAQIFSGQITTWDDSRITSTNANFSQWNIPPKQKIQLVVRSDVSDVTLVYKSAMLAFSPTFGTFVDTSARPTWGNLTVTKLEGFAAVNTYILVTPWTIGYSVLQNAVDANLPRVQIWKAANIVVDASVKTTTFAVLELGLAFGNNGDDPSRLTADLNNARGLNGWPIATYTYVVLRTSTLRAGATCDNVHDTVAFWQWFLTAGVIQGIAESHYFVQPPSVVRDLVVQRLVSDVTCLGTPVFQAPPALQVTAAGEITVAQALQDLAGVYAIDEPQMSLQYTSGTLNTSDAVATALLSNQLIAVQQPSLAPATGTATILFAGVAVVVISQYNNLVLDPKVLARILDGDIQSWWHPDLVALNPNGYQDASGNTVPNASQRIALINGPSWDSGLIQSVLQRYAPSFTGKALQSAYKLQSEAQLQTVVAGYPFTLGITTSATGLTSSRVKLASMKKSPGIRVLPTASSILACAPSATYSLSGGMDLLSSSDAGCYPLSSSVYLLVQMPQCNNASADSTDAEDSIDAEAVAFLKWALADNSTAAALQGSGLALLAAATPAVRAANAQALADLTCSSPAPATVPSSSANIIPIIAGACVGALLVIGIPVAWYVRKSNRDMRALRKQFSDVKVAEDCAEAIACFDLEAVSWLANLAKPTKIQLAFLRIVSLLVEVKPFIPDQLMAQLQAAKNGEELPKPDSPAAARESRRGTHADDHTVATSQSQTSLHSSSFRSTRSVKIVRGDSSKLIDGRPHTSVSEGSSGVRKPTRAARPGAAAGNQNADRYRRTCTFMYVRFIITGNPEADKLGQLATTVAAHVVTLGKSHGATIDKVTYDSVSLHWNVSTQCSGAPLQAAALAMELACTAQVLASDVQDNLRLLVGIGHGPSTVATVSAAGQRFFVVGGPEITNAIEVVMREVALPLGCAVLLSNAVQQEVKFGFRCSPRLWFHDVLFWEPVEKRGGCKVDDEWMYQIKHMEQDDSTLDVVKALNDLFLLARSCQSLGVLQREVRHLQQRYAEHLTPQDLASLNLLQEPSGRQQSLVVSTL